jgi:hypothetical protein
MPFVIFVALKAFHNFYLGPLFLRRLVESRRALEVAYESGCKCNFLRKSLFLNFSYNTFF